MKTLLLMALTVITQTIFASDEKALEPILAGYDEVRTVVAYDKFDEIEAKLNTLIKTIDEWTAKAATDDADVALVGMLRDNANALYIGHDDAELRIRFSPFSGFASALVRGKKSLESQYQLYFCHMVKKPNFAYWFQKIGTPMANPYMGTKMLKCGMKKPWSAIPVPHVHLG